MTPANDEDTAAPETGGPAEAPAEHADTEHADTEQEPISAAQENSAINSQITDALSETIAMLAGQAPETAAAGLIHAAAQSAAAAMLNAASAQQQGYILANAATAQIVARILSVSGRPSPARAEMPL